MVLQAEEEQRIMKDIPRSQGMQKDEVGQLMGCIIKLQPIRFNAKGNVKWISTTSNDKDKKDTRNARPTRAIAPSKDTESFRNLKTGALRSRRFKTIRISRSIGVLNFHCGTCRSRFFADLPGFDHGGVGNIVW